MSDKARDSNQAQAAEQSSELDARGDAYRVSLPMFEGPLDLLLHLIQKHELDILDIPIGFIAEKYVEYINLMEEMSIDLASEYLVMAATLVHLKSRSLLPADPHPGEDETIAEEELDPRAELVRRLLEYQKYKHAAETLAERPLLGRDVFARGAPAELSTDPAPLAPLSLFKLVDAFEAVLKRARRVVEHEVDFDRITITDKIGQISEALKQHGTLRFDQLFERDASRAEMIVTFLALLEMTKLRMTRLRQDRPLDPIYVELAVSPDEGGLVDFIGDEFVPARSEAAALSSLDADVDDELREPAADELPAWLSAEGDEADDTDDLDVYADAPESEPTPDELVDGLEERAAESVWGVDDLARAARILAEDLAEGGLEPAESGATSDPHAAADTAPLAQELEVHPEGTALTGILDADLTSTELVSDPSAREASAAAPDEANAAPLDAAGSAAPSEPTEDSVNPGPASTEEPAS